MEGTHGTLSALEAYGGVAVSGSVGYDNGSGPGIATDWGLDGVSNINMTVGGVQDNKVRMSGLVTPDDNSALYNKLEQINRSAGSVGSGIVLASRELTDSVGYNFEYPSSLGYSIWIKNRGSTPAWRWVKNQKTEEASQTLINAALQWHDAQPKIYKKPINQYKTGGLADFTGPAWLDGTPSKPEYILNAEQTQGFFALVDILENLKKDSPSKSEKTGDNYFEIQIQVDTLTSDYDVDNLADKIRKMLYDDASYRNVNAIKFLR